jgi:hypothetical protein
MQYFIDMSVNWLIVLQLMLQSYWSKVVKHLFQVALEQVKVQQKLCAYKKLRKTGEDSQLRHLLPYLL